MCTRIVHRESPSLSMPIVRAHGTSSTRTGVKASRSDYDDCTAVRRVARHTSTGPSTVIDSNRLELMRGAETILAVGHRSALHGISTERLTMQAWSMVQSHSSVGVTPKDPVRPRAPPGSPSSAPARRVRPRRMQRLHPRARRRCC